MKRTALTLLALLAALSALSASARAVTIQQVPNLTGLIFPLRINSVDDTSNTPTLVIQSQDAQGNFVGAMSGTSVVGKVEVGPGQTLVDASGIQVSFTQTVSPTVKRKFVGGFLRMGTPGHGGNFLAGTYYTMSLVKTVIGPPLKPIQTLTRTAVSGPFPFCSGGFYLPG